jgi:hypothetical protein
MPGPAAVLLGQAMQGSAWQAVLYLVNGLHPLTKPLCYDAALGAMRMALVRPHGGGPSAASPQQQHQQQQNVVVLQQLLHRHLDEMCATEKGLGDLAELCASCPAAHRVHRCWLMRWAPLLLAQVCLTKRTPS